MFLLKNRAIIEISGEDCLKTLQGLITNDIERLQNQGIIYSAMLSPQGRFWFDFFIIALKLLKNGDEINFLLLDCHESMAEGLIKKLNLYKLRSKTEVKLTDSALSNIENNQNSYWQVGVSFNKCHAKSSPPIYQSPLKLEQNPALVYQGTPQRGDADISARKNSYRNPKDSDIFQSSLKLEQNPALVYQGTPQRGDADISARKNSYRNPKDFGIELQDPRHLELGFRVYQRFDQTSRNCPENSQQSQQLQVDYHRKRFCLKIAEGFFDLDFDQSFILNYGFDYLGAVEYKKGCYLGQETTARMHYRGGINKKIHHFRIKNPNLDLIKAIKNRRNIQEIGNSANKNFDDSLTTLKNCELLRNDDIKPVGRFLSSIIDENSIEGLVLLKTEPKTSSESQKVVEQNAGNYRPSTFYLKHENQDSEDSKKENYQKFEIEILS